MKTIFDTCVWVAFLNENDSQHKKAREVIKKQGSQIILPEYILTETAMVLQKILNKKIVDNFLCSISDNEDVELLYSSKFFCDKLVSFFQYQKNTTLSFVDCSLVLLSQEYKIVTFDRELNEAVKLFK